MNGTATSGSFLVHVNLNVHDVIDRVTSRPIDMDSYEFVQLRSKFCDRHTCDLDVWDPKCREQLGDGSPPRGYILGRLTMGFKVGFYPRHYR